MKKYEIYLPLKYNDGSDIEPEKLEEIQQQLIAVFGAITVSSLSTPFQGTWRYGGVEFVDDIIRIEIITDEDLCFFRNFKRQLNSSCSGNSSCKAGLMVRSRSRMFWREFI
jgi:hypothetical protein